MSNLFNFSISTSSEGLCLTALIYCMSRQNRNFFNRKSIAHLSPNVACLVSDSLDQPSSSKASIPVSAIMILSKRRMFSFAIWKWPSVTGSDGL